MSLELLPDMVWQPPAFNGTLRLKSRIVFFNKLVKKGLFRTMGITFLE
jgi:hypothetical protein